MVFGTQPDTPKTPTLTAFLRNFCAARPGPSPDAGTIVRTTMTQPGVYFTLDAPFVSIIGLYTNVLEGPGVISSQGGHVPDRRRRAAGVPDGGARSGSRLRGKRSSGR